MSTSVAAGQSTQDDAVTICAISALAFLVGDVSHEAVGHALLALLTGTQSGVLSAVAWSSSIDSRLVAAGGTLVNLVLGGLLWLALRAAKNASVGTRLFLLLSCTFNLFTGTGYFCFSGVTNFGDWAVVIAPLHPHWLWRTLLVLVGAAAYYAAVLVVGQGIVRYVGVSITSRARLRRFLFLPYFSAIAIAIAGALPNPVGIALVWESALPATAGANSGLLWLRHYIPSSTVPERSSPSLERSYAWIAIAVLCSLVFIFIIGRGITLHR
jgi:hypothetical protein